MRTLVLDTNVLLLDPDALLAYPGDEIVLPEVILGELDKIKVSRSDADTRFRGREISRLLFELSEGSSLVDGVALPNNGTLRIVPFDTDKSMPEGFSAKNPDDRIIVTAWLLHKNATEGDHVLLITNDLNMLLKAQTLGIPIQRHDGGDDSSFAKKYLIRPFQRYRTPLLIMAISIAIFAASIVIAINTSVTSQESILPSEYRNFLTEEQAGGIDALIMLQSNPSDSESLLTIAKLYYSYYEKAVIENSAQAISYAKKGTQYYQRYLDLVPTDADARVEKAILTFYTGDTDSAIEDLQTVLESTPDHVRGNYNLGVVYMQGRHDYDLAETYFAKVIELSG
ncbi:MAG: hypothetical protein HGA54_04935, partial [Actinobacteria bacterium]|nr:hypothetical protein [Actinomycetota bacterium]